MSIYNVMVVILNLCKEFSYMLEIDILRNSLKTFLGVLKGDL